MCCFLRTRRPPGTTRTDTFFPYPPLFRSWLEEPLPAYDVETYAALREGASIRIAAGEMAASAAELECLIRRRAVDVLQVDISRIGLTEGRSEEHTSELQSLMRHSYAAFCLKKQHRHTQYLKSLRRPS